MNNSDNCNIKPHNNKVMLAILFSGVLLWIVISFLLYTLLEKIDDNDKKLDIVMLQLQEQIAEMDAQEKKIDWLSFTIDKVFNEWELK